MTKEYGKTWDGVTRPSDNTYRENYNSIFGVKKKNEEKKEEKKKDDTDK